MEGQFKHENKRAAILFLIGAAAIWSGISMGISRTDAVFDGETRLFIGCLAVSGAVALFFYNRGAYLVVEDHLIISRCGWLSRLRVTAGELAYVNWYACELTFKLKSGKTYTIFGLINAAQVCAHLRRLLEEQPENRLRMSSAISLSEQLKAAKRRVLRASLAFLTGAVALFCLFLWIAARKKSGMWISLLEALLFVLYLTALVLALIALHRYENIDRDLRWISVLQRRAALESAPYPPGNPVAAYINADFTYRVLVCAYPNARDVYCIVEAGGALRYSPVYDSMEALAPELEGLISIPFSEAL